MAKRKFNLTQSEIIALQAAYQQEADGPTRTRFQAVRLYGQNYPVAEIQSLTGCARSTLLSWCAKYQQAGLEGLRDHRGGRQAARLTVEQIAQVREKLRQYRPYDILGSAAISQGQYWTVADLYQAVKHWFGVTYASRTSYLNLFDACGFSYQRTEQVFKSRRASQVLDFEADTEKKSSILPKVTRRPSF